LISVLEAGFEDHGRPGVVLLHGFPELAQKNVCTRLLGTHFVDGAGHWVQQEQPAEVVTLLMRFLEPSAPVSVGR
jgi:hypothetical protein